ncbi:MAG TPA: alpha/beta-type small acid-soluble spore protein [Candidatus Blautia gallistercoris]|uniref:Alpha/beta-type small acid-soluble spore protein n=1 Tax=Candidatus Blautia gallistercoris TaxID=2838490 RepID=A0A9D1WJB8_9FIRM|nr:alpha/beta-type small acid-soluble spore protein [Candidatus Blautia gallistercoris]
MGKEKEIEAYRQNLLTPQEKLKYEIAEEMGLLDRVLTDGWRSLSAKETGRIGGLMTRRRKEKMKKD